MAEGEDLALIVTDLVMPRMGGRELLRVLHERHPDVKALVMTGYAVNGSMKELEGCGVVEVVEKPFEVARLAQAVSRALEGASDASDPGS